MKEFRGSFPKAPVKGKAPKRKPVKPVSDRRMSEKESRALVKARVFERDGGCVLFDVPGTGPCEGIDTVHHVQKAGQLGPYTEENLVTLCWRHNAIWVEENPAEAKAIGMVRSWWESA